MDILEVTDKKTLLQTLPLLNVLLTEEKEKPVTEEQAWTGFEKASQTGYRQFYMAADNDGIIGVIGLRSFYDPLSIDIGFEVNNLIIAPKKRGQGLGTELFNHALDKAKNEGALWIRLMVYPSNDKAITFYNKHNFKHTANLMLWEK